MRPDQHRDDLLGTFAKHPVAANLLMVLMLLAGGIALKLLNVQFFPSFELDVISVRTIWSGASAGDVETGITTPLEQRLRNVDSIKEMTSTSASGVSSITLEFEEGTDPMLALDQAKREVENFTSLPTDAETPEVTRVVRYESVARLLISGPENPLELRGLAHEYERSLLAAGIDKVEINGLPEEALVLEFEAEQLQRLGLSLNEISERVQGLSRDLPAGIAGEDDGARELRSLGQRRQPAEFKDLSLIAEVDARVDLGDVAHIERRPKDGGVLLSVGGKPAVELVLQRSENGDSLVAARTLEQWLQEIRPQLTPGIEVIVFEESWQLIRDRIMLLVKNGGTGLLFVLATLYLFMAGRVAFWVAVGIPVSFMATLMVLYLAGGSINMVSLFALIMALGIIVDDAIVVGEDALAHSEMGEDPLKASEGGARRMLGPVMASSLTTIAAFLPLILIGGRIGNILSAIPMVIMAVIVASLVESFLILPGHLRNVFVHKHQHRRHGIRDRLDAGFIRFRDTGFRPLAELAIRYRGTTITAALAMLMLGIGLLAGGRLGFVFFPSPEGQTIYANVRFVAGTPRANVDEYLGHLEQTLYQTDAELGGGLVKTAVVRHGASSGFSRSSSGGDEAGSIHVELISPDAREVRNREFVRVWREKVRAEAGIENFTITERLVGPPGRGLDIRMLGDDAERLKAAALELAEALKAVPGVSEVEDDLAYGREQLIYSLSPAGQALGLSVSSLGQQLRAAYDGALVQSFQDGPDEVEVRVQLPRAQQRSLSSLDELPIRLPDGRFVPLLSVAEWSSGRGFEALRHADGRLAVEVSANVDNSVNNANEIIASLRESTIPGLAARHAVAFSFEGRAASQRETLADMRTGMLIGLLLIYIVLAWVFGSYGWPLIVMMVIPFGLTGALFGHWLMDMNLTILSLFGFFGLSGIVVNDSIILVTFYKQLRRDGMAYQQALVEAACQRLRAVLLTSLTTIGGLTPLLFETSTQAQFLIPMATSIAFGLAFATVLILLVLPALLSIYEGISARWQASRQALATAGSVP